MSLLSVDIREEKKSPLFADIFVSIKGELEESLS